MCLKRIAFAAFEQKLLLSLSLPTALRDHNQSRSGMSNIKSSGVAMYLSHLFAGGITKHIHTFSQHRNIGQVDGALESAARSYHTAILIPHFSE